MGASSSVDQIGSVHILFILQFIFANVKTENIIKNLSPNDGSDNDGFGYRVSRHNNYALVGAQKIASAYIFEQIQGNWIQVAKLSPSDSSGSSFGKSVSIYNQTALIGAYKYNSNAGAAYIFSRNASGEWVQETKLLLSDPESLYFGATASLYNEYALIGDKQNYYIFEKINGNWTQVRKLRPTNDTLNNIYGESVSIYKNYALLGAYFEDNYSGAAYVFERVNASWMQVAKLQPMNVTSTSDRFGISVSLNNEYALIGAFRSDDNGEDSGCAYVFYNMNGSWSHVTKLLPDDGYAGDGFGVSVSLHEKQALIGAKFDDDKSGSAYIFERRSHGARGRSIHQWVQTAKLVPTDGIANDFFGTSVCLDNDYVLIGAPNYNNHGSAYMIENEFTFSPTQAPTTMPPTTIPPTPSPIACPYNTFEPISGECFTCNAGDDGYVCKGGSIVNVAYGYWVFAHIKNENSAQLTTFSLINNSYSMKSSRCPAGQCCAKHIGCEYIDSHFSQQSSASNMSQMRSLRCAKQRNISSLTCSRCNDGYYELLGTSACGQCEDTNYMYLIIVVMMALIFTVFLLFCLSRPTQLLSNIMSANDEIHWRKLMWYDQKTLVAVLVFKIYLYYYQGLSQLLSMKNITPNSQLEETLLTLFNFDVSILSVSNEGICFIARIQSGIYELLLSYTWYICISIHVIIIAFVYFVYTKLFIRANTSSYKPYIKAGCIYIMLMIVGPLLSTSFKFLTCIKFIDDKYYHLYDAYMVCYGYIWWFAGVFPIVAVCGALLMLWFIVYQQNPSERETASNAYWSLTKRFKNNMWFYEFILFIRRLGIAALTSFYDVEDKMISVVLASFIMILFAVQIKYNPFKHQTANIIESMCLFGTASMIIALIVFDDDSTGISLYFTFLILAPLFIIAVIIINIVYKCYKYRDQQAHVSYTNLRKRWLNQDIELQSQISNNLLNRKQQIERANNIDELIPFIERQNIGDIKEFLLKCDDDDEKADGSQCDSVSDSNVVNTPAKAVDDRVYWRDNDRGDSEIVR